MSDLSSSLPLAPVDPPSRREGSAKGGKAPFAAAAGRSLLAGLGLLAVVSLSARQVPASEGKTYHVAPGGSDSQPGSPEQPFRTIQHAADVAGAGDTVLVHAGVYRESVDVRRSGTPGAPVVFRGERDADGQWLTILDRSEPIVGWTEAPEIGPGVFKTSEPGFNPACVTLDGKMLARIRDDFMAGDQGRDLLTVPSDALVKTEERIQRSARQLDYGNHTAPEHRFWDAVKAIYGHRDGVTYLRFRDGDDPSGMPLLAVPGGGVNSGNVDIVVPGTEEESTGGFRIVNHSHVVLRDFLVRGAEFSVRIQGERATHNLIEDNHLTHGRVRVLIADGASHNIVRNNEITLGYYGHDRPGSWGGAGGRDMDASLACFVYRFFKYVIGPGTSDDLGVGVTDGEGNEIAGNLIRDGLRGIGFQRTRDLRVHGNTVRGMSSIGIMSTLADGYGAVDARIHDNLISDCNINLRVHRYHSTLAGQRSEYYYRNAFHQPRLGSHVFFHWGVDDAIREGGGHSEVAFYHNTFSRGSIRPGVGAHLEGTIFVNNVFSGTNWDRGVLAAVDRNYFGGVRLPAEAGAAAGFGQGNLTGDPVEGWEEAAALPDFRLPADHPARAAGIDLSQPFDLGGKQRPPLPGMEPGYFDGPAPDLGLVPPPGPAPSAGRERRA